MRLQLILNFSFLILNWLCASARPPLGVAYYDVDHIYDTIPALFYNDTDYTPDGRLRWTTARYGRKIEQIAAVIDSMQMPVTGLCGVENEAVVRDIAAACKTPYTYLHRTLNTLDGMDFALLYFGDVFLPDYTEAGNNYLYAEGALRGERVGFLLSRSTHFAEWAVRDLHDERPGVRLVVMGRVQGIHDGDYGLHDATARAEAAERGNVRYRNGWLMRDRILADTALCAVSGDVFARRYLVDAKTGYPTPTYDRKRYLGGASYALPVFVYIP